MKRFSKNDTGFVCVHCRCDVTPLGVSSRDHCTHCLHGLHVDVNPGDRANECGGVLVPSAVSPDAKHGYVIHYICAGCGARVNNRAAKDDNFEEILRVCKAQKPQS